MLRKYISGISLFGRFRVDEIAAVDQITAIVKLFQTQQLLLNGYYNNGFQDLINGSIPEFNALNIKKLGGANNSIYIASLKDDPNWSAVFKVVENDNGLVASEFLRKNKLEKYLTKQHALIPTMYADKEQTYYSHYLQISEFCKEGDLRKKAENFEGSVTSRQASTITYAKNLLRMMIDFDKAGVGFPDIKPSNFLINNNDELVISDTKLLFCLKDKKVRNFKFNEHGSTKGYLPPELTNARGFNIDELQRYLIGVTIYEYATGHMVAEDARNLNNEHAFNFKHEVFEGKEGSLLLTIIHKLTITNPHARLSFEKALQDIELHTLDNAPKQGMETFGKRF